MIALADIVEDIADELGWQVSPLEGAGSWSLPRVLGPDGERLAFYRDLRSRILIRGLLPGEHEQRALVETPSISLAGDRPASVIASAINRRLLPVYRERVAEALESIRRFEAGEEAQRSLGVELAELSGAEYDEDQGRICSARGQWHGKAAVERGGARVHLEGSLSAEVARAVFAALGRQALTERDSPRSVHSLGMSNRELDLARYAGLDHVALACRPDNAAARAVIEHHGGVSTEKSPDLLQNSIEVNSDE
ncbi:MAG: hypothetical protein ACRCYU_23500 [Nocardioides sp.]